MLILIGGGQRREVGLGNPESLEDIVDVVEALEPGDFVKSETAYNPVNHLV